MSVLATAGGTFLFYPAILALYHKAIDHTTTTLQQPDDRQNPQENTNVLLSLVIPAYNEQDRITVMLDECYEYFGKQPKCKAIQTLLQAYQQQHHGGKKKSPPSILVEWIVVNDGSNDNTCQVVQGYVDKLEDDQQPFLWKLVTLPVNEGKGAAVQVGMTEATGFYRLMVDADGATTFEQGLEAVSKAMLESITDPSKEENASPTIIFGSRAGDDVQRTALRAFLMHSFLWLRSCVVGTPLTLRDTQCGFKLFDKYSAMQLFSNLHLRRWAFDIELVYVALCMGMAIQEVTVPWHEVDGSKLNTGFLALLMVSIGMLRDMMCVRACYVLGIWTIQAVATGKL
ncbi:Dolichyl-phosphate beta-glucosyltransferase [Seminavis robusta]|uniref:dolichyl-phosphate beta-glucosyltransferase n=1 Tax=Seminavis robusta TaxID=568900 RepID=A0A9N8D6B6_9STRA|nr:Dolichyl-phosphate beta-glucosyltransferase [Seminavis robusta]|eukprot:Sro17_g012180.1 Dolichyl-phosphate beta-glucosyltransferase (342) ;mRNA; f:46180-47205